MPGNMCFSEIRAISKLKMCTLWSQAARIRDVLIKFSKRYSENYQTIFLKTTTKEVINIMCT